MDKFIRLSSQYQLKMTGMAKMAGQIIGLRVKRSKIL